MITAGLVDKKQSSIDLNIHLQPVQAKLIKLYEQSKATKIGFGGARGGTKSHTADMLMLIRRLKYPQTNGLFVMRVYQDMMDIHIIPFFEQFPELRKYFISSGNMILKLPNGSYIRYLSGDSLETFQKRKGRGFADIIVDQSELFTEDEIQFLYTINRSTKPGIVAKTLLCFNPGNIGHSYHKRIFYDKIYKEGEDPNDYAYMQTRGWDNAYWSLSVMAKMHGIDEKTMDEHKILELVNLYHRLPERERFEIFLKTNYGHTLNQLPEHKKRAELYGDMEIFEGMFFEDFRRNFHVIDYRIIPTRKTIGGLDYGNITVLEILQMDSEGTIIFADELYLDNETNPTDRANAIADFLEERELYRIEIIYDTDMEISQISNIGVDKTPIEIFRQVFRQRMRDKAPLMRVVSKKSLDTHKTYRQAVNEAVKDYLKIRSYCSRCKKEVTAENGKCKICETIVDRKSKIYFSTKVKQLIKFMSEAIYENEDTMDFNRSMQPKTDHPYDAGKYAFMEFYYKKRPIDNQTPRWFKELLKQEYQKASNPKSFMGV